MEPDIRRFPQDYKKQDEIWVLKPKEVNDMPTKQEAVEKTIISNQLRSLTERLEVTRKSIKLMEDQEEQIKKDLKEAVADLGIKELTALTLPFDLGDGHKGHIKLVSTVTFNRFQHITCKT